MFASPSYLSLKSMGGENNVDFDQLSYQKEYGLIKESLKKAKKEITVHKVHGTY